MGSEQTSTAGETSPGAEASLWRRGMAALGVARLTVSAEGRILEADEGFARLSGVAPGHRSALIGDAVGQWLDAVGEDGWPLCWRELSRNGVLELRSGLRARDGTYPALDLRATRVIEPDGRTYAVLFAVLRAGEEASARYERARLEFLLAESEDGLFDWDLLADRVFASPGARRLFDLDRAELTGASAVMRALIHPDDRARIGRDFAALLRGDVTTFRHELRVTRASGAVSWILCRARAIERTRDGRVGRILGTTVDITPRRRVEETLRRERDLLDAVIRTSVTALIVQDTEGSLLYANPEAARMLGYPRAELLGRLRRADGWPISDLDGEPCGPGALPFEQVVRTGQTVVGARYLVQTGGDRRQICVSINSAPTRDAEGRINRVVSTLEDITDRLAAENAIRQSEKRLREVLDRLPVAVEVIGADGVVTQFNPAAARLFGMPVERMAGADAFGRAWPLMDEEGAPVRYPDHPFFAPWLAGEAVRDQAVVVTPADGSAPRWALASAMPRTDDEGRLVDVVCTFTDITLRKQMELSLLQAQKVESIGRLAGGIAHDFNNLLTAVLGGADLAAAELPLDHPAQEDLLRVIEAAERGAALTHQLLGYARKQPIRPRVVDVPELVHRAAGMLERLIGEDVRLHIGVRADAAWVVLDPGQFDQVLVNLAVNARDAMPGGGDLYIDIDDHARIPTAEALPASRIVLRVRDTGPGIPADVLPRIFEPFFTTKAPGEGTGLGLSVCYGIVKQNRGVILVDAPPGLGTTFEVILPRSPAPPEPARGTRARAPQPGKGTLLLVEDDDVVCDTASRALSRAGYTVVTASDGAKALRIIDSGRPIDGVITDVVLPAVGGRALADALAERRPAVPILFTSGHADDLLGEHGVLRVGVDFLAKPYTPEQLCRRVQAMLAVRP